MDNSPRFPEWQCQMQSLRPDGGDFWAMPVHCQKEILATAGMGLMDQLGIRRPRAENPNNLRGALHEAIHSGLPTGQSGVVNNAGASSSVIAAGLSSSSKAAPDCEADGNTIHVCTNVPRSDIPGFEDASLGSDSSRGLG